MQRSDDERLEDLLTRCYAEMQAGRSPDLDVICRGEPELRPQVAQLLARELELARDAHGEASPGSPRLPDMLEAGTVLGEFRIVAPLDAGGMGDVYIAVQEPLGRQVALKVMSCRTSIDRVAALRFRREAEITAALNHQNIVPVFASGEANGVLFLAMRLLHGPSLHRVGRLPPRQVARIGAAVARALHAAHQIGVVHRDVKPANIVLEGDVPFVLDFGLARSADAETLTRNNGVPGTLPYMAPEQLRGGAPLDARTDVYGLGATLYEALRGTPPFAADPLTAAVHRILTVDPPPLRHVDRDLAVIVARAMHKRPARRFAAAADMADDLERYLAAEPIRSRPVSAAERAVRYVGRHRVASALALVAATLLIGLVTVLMLQARDRGLRWQTALDAAATSIVSGDLPAARQQLAVIATAFGSDEREHALHAEMATEQDLQALATSLMQYKFVDLPTVARLAGAIESATPHLARSPRADAAVVLAARLLQRENLVQSGVTLRHVLRPTTRSAWPRTAMVLDALAQEQNPAERLATMVLGKHDPLDHLWAALAMRIGNGPEQFVESELRLADSSGANGDAVRYALATAMEAQSRHVIAYDLLRQLTGSPVFGLVASCDCARLGAALGRDGDARLHLARALAAAENSPHLRDLIALTELEVLQEVDDWEGFWRRWHELRPLLQHRQQYWLRAGYAEATDANDAAALVRARAHFDRAAACQSGLASSSVDLAILQVDWMASAGPQSMSPLTDDEASPAQRAQLVELAERAERLAAKIIAQRTAPAVAADAL
jgi:hypothetical protein